MGTFSFDPHGHMTEAEVRKQCRELSRSLFREQQQRERFEEEVECSHKWLDDRAVPRADAGGDVFSLVGRMTRLTEISRT